MVVDGQGASEYKGNATRSRRLLARTSTHVTWHFSLW